MTAQELKNSILQLAVQGKLVEQRPEEGTAKELLAQIKAEKEQLIKDKKIKKEKPLPEITDEEKPFDIPESWEWVRLGDFSTINGGYAFKSVNFCDEGVRVVRISDFNEKGFIDTKIVRHKFDKSLEMFLLKEKDILLCMTGGTVGKNYFIKKLDEPMMTNQRVATIRTLNVCEEFVNLLILSPIVQSIIHKNKNSTNDNISMDTINCFVCPLPPLEEQKRIVSKIEEILPYIEQYDKAYTKLEAFNKKFPEDMKKSVLQLAMQGKLVEQRPEEGTAEELYQQIVEEKAKLIKEGKIKKEKPLAEITDEEIPFEIPVSWKWVRVGEVIKEVIVPQRDKPSFSNEGIPWCRIEDRDGILLNGSKSNQLVSEETIEKMNLKVLPVGAVLSACTGGSIGTIVINTVKCCTNQTFNAIVCSSGVHNWYLFWFLTSKFSELRRIGAGTTMAYISQQKTKEMLIPLPPFEEQKRIVARIEEILPYCEQLVK